MAYSPSILSQRFPPYDVEHIGNWSCDARIYFMTTESGLWPIVNQSKYSTPLDNPEYIRARELLLGCVPIWLKAVMENMLVPQMWLFLTRGFPSYTSVQKEELKFGFARRLQAKTSIPPQPTILTRLKSIEEKLDMHSRSIHGLFDRLRLEENTVEAIIDNLTGRTNFSSSG